jgi:hypothetical protein
MSDFGIWSDSHPRLGLAILALAILQPIFGAVHHRLFKRRSAAAAAGTASKAPGRTLPYVTQEGLEIDTDTCRGYIHLWVGRSLIVLGIINGGLGIRLSSYSPFRTDNQTRTSAIIYGVIAGVMFGLYVLLVVLFELRRKRAARQATVAITKESLPRYEESQSSSTSIASQRNTGGPHASAPDNAVRYS